MSLSMRMFAPWWVLGCLLILHFASGLRIHHQIPGQNYELLTPVTSVLTSVCGVGYNGISQYLWTCQKLIRCTDGQPSLEACPNGAGFNPYKLTCEAFYRYPGCFDEFPPPPPTTRAPCVSPPKDREGIQSGKYYPDCYPGSNGYTW